MKELSIMDAGIGRSNCLPDSIFEYRKATIEDIDELVRTGIIVLRVANKLSDDARWT